MKNTPITIVIVDDSKLMRGAVNSIFQGNNHLEIIGEADNGVRALQVLRGTRPDVVILDIHMPVMDGLTALKHIMIENPLPAVMLSSLTKEGSRIAFDSLKYGAVDFVTKPEVVHENSMKEHAHEIISKVTMAAEVRPEKLQYIKIAAAKQSLKALPDIEPRKLIVIGAAEGGYGALLRTIPALRRDTATAYVIVMHIAPAQLDGFCSYLKKISDLDVRRVMEGRRPRAGGCYLCSGDEYVTLVTMGNRLGFHVSPAPFSTRRGSINMMMFAAAERFQQRATGVILSGLGDDGAEGVGEILAHGGNGIVQHPDSCLFKMMPGETISHCHNVFVVRENTIARAISMCSTQQ